MSHTEELLCFNLSQKPRAMSDYEEAAERPMRKITQVIEYALVAHT
jgi:hypothetical protein